MKMPMLFTVIVAAAVVLANFAPAPAQGPFVPRGKAAKEKEEFPFAPVELVPSPALADDKMAANLFRMTESQINALLHDSYNRASKRLEFRIGELQQDGPLSPTQVARLRVAAKGALEYYLQLKQDWARKIAAAIAKAESMPQIEKILEDQGWTSFGLGVGFPILDGPARLGNDSLEIEQQPIWVAALASELSDEQRAHQKKAAAERLAKRRQDLITPCITALTTTLSLNDDQRERISPLITQALEKDRMFNAFLNDPAYADRELRPRWLSLKDVSEENLKAVLTESQVATWKRLANQNEGMMPIAAPQKPNKGRNKANPDDSESTK